MINTYKGLQMRISFRVGRKFGETERGANVVMRSLLNHVEKEVIKTTVKEVLDELKESVQAQEAKTRDVPHLPFLNDLVHGALWLDNGLDLQYLPPLSPKPLTNSKVKVKKRGLPFAKKSRISDIVRCASITERDGQQRRRKGWTAHYHRLLFLQANIRGHIVRCAVRRAVKGLTGKLAPLYTAHFDPVSGHQYYFCSTSQRITWQRPLLLFPKPKRSSTYLIVYAQSQARRRLSCRAAAVLAKEIIVRIPIPQTKKRGKKSKKRLENEAVRYLYYNTKSGHSSADPPELLYDIPASELKVRTLDDLERLSKWRREIERRYTQAGGDSAQINEITFEEWEAENKTTAAVVGGRISADETGELLESRVTAPKKKKLSKREKADQKLRDQHERATLIQATFRGHRTQVATGKVMVYRRLYVRELDQLYRKYHYLYRPSNRNSWVKPRVLWGLTDNDFTKTAPPTFLERAKGIFRFEGKASQKKGRVAPELKSTAVHSKAAPGKSPGATAKVNDETSDPHSETDIGATTAPGLLELYVRSLLPEPEPELEPEPSIAEEDFSEGW